MRSVIVLGAGMVGIGAAVHLLKRGFSVALVDRRGPGEETSHGNAGLVQSEAVEPYPMPRDLPTLTRVALGLTNDVHYRLAALPGHLESFLRYWWTSAPQRYEAVVRAWAPLIGHAVAEHEALIAEAGAGALVRRDGYLSLHRTQRAFDLGAAEARRLAERHGVPSRVLGPREVRALELSLTGPVTGAVHWTDPIAVSDPGALARAYVDFFVRSGGRFVSGDAESLTSTGRGWSVTTADGPVEAEIVVVALGPWSPAFLTRFGYRFSMVRKRGYHQHYAGGAGLGRPVFDSAWGYVLAPMARGLRITTGAEFTFPDAPATPVQLERAERAARGLLDLGSAVDPEPWFGTRPFMAEMLPMIGPAPNHPGLWFDFGHGHQGFTLGPASGRLIAELIDGAEPIVDAAAFRPRG
jgi:D-amino-acid dehydrogenase